MRFDFFYGRKDVRVLVKAVILTSLIFVSFFLGSGISKFLWLSDDYLSGIWCAISAIVVFDDLPENAKTLMRDRLLGTFVGAFLTTLFIYLGGNLYLSIAVSLFCTCLLITVFNWTGALKIGCITVIIVGLTTHDKPFNIVWESGLMRFLESVFGGLLSLFATVIIERIRKKMN